MGVPEIPEPLDGASAGGVPELSTVVEGRPLETASSEDKVRGEMMGASTFRVMGGALVTREDIGFVGGRVSVGALLELLLSSSREVSVSTVLTSSSLLSTRGGCCWIAPTMAKRKPESKMRIKRKKYGIPGGIEDSIGGFELKAISTPGD